MVWYFIGVYIINRTLNGRLEIRNFSSRVEKYFTRSLRSLVKYFSTREEKFRFGHVISSISFNVLRGYWYVSLSTHCLNFDNFRDTAPPILTSSNSSCSAVTTKSYLSSHFFYSSILFWPTCKVGTSSLTGVKFTLANRLSANALTWCARKMGEW